MNKEFEASRAGAVAHEAENELRGRRADLLDEVKDFQNCDLKKVEEAIAILSEALPREAVLYRKIEEFNRLAQKIGLDAIESPEISRHRPKEPQRENGTQAVQRTRRKDATNNAVTLVYGPAGFLGGLTNAESGARRYETYMADEAVIIPEVPEFKPAPLYLRVIVPSLHRDGPKYSPANFPLPWYGRDGNG